MSDDFYDPGEHGKVIWPIKEGTVVEYADAYATLFDISECILEVSHYHQNGSDYTGNLEIHLSGWQAYDDAPGTYFAKPLKQALEEELEKLVDCDETDEELAELRADPKFEGIAEKILRRRPEIHKSRRLVELLLAAYATWEAECVGP